MAIMAAGSSTGLTDRQRAALDSLVADLRTIFGAGLQALVAYGLHALPADGPDAYMRTLGLVERVTFDDLARLVPLVSDGSNRSSPFLSFCRATSSSERWMCSRWSTGASSPTIT